MPAKLQGSVLCKLTPERKTAGRKKQDPRRCVQVQGRGFRCKYAVFVVCCKCRFGGKGVDPKRKAALCPHWFCKFTPE